MADGRYCSAVRRDQYKLRSGSRLVRCSVILYLYLRSVDFSVIPVTLAQTSQHASSVSPITDRLFSCLYCADDRFILAHSTSPGFTRAGVFSCSE